MESVKNNVPTEYVDSNKSPEKITNMSVEDASAHMKSREASPTLFYNAKDWEAFSVLRNNGKTKLVRWNDNSSSYQRFARATETYNRSVDDYFISAESQGKMSQSDSEKFRNYYKTSRGHLNPKGNQGSSHLRDSNSNLIWENLFENRESKARMSFANYVNNMDQSGVDGIRIPQGELDKIDEFVGLTENNKVDGFNGNQIKGIQEWAHGKLGVIENPVDSNDMRYKDKFFTAHGNFRNYNEMLDLGIVSNPEDFEKARRLWITMMESNPEFDLDGFMDNSVDTIGNQQLKHGLSKDVDIDWDTIRKGNAPVAGNFSKRAKILSLMKKAPLGILGLLAASGATYAADGGSDEDYLDHVLANLEKYDNVSVQPGKQAIMQGADAVGAGDALRATENWYQQNMSAVPEGPTKAVADFIWGMGKDIVSEPVGLIQSAIETPVAPEENVSFRQQQQQQYNQGLLQNRWTND